MPIIVQSTSPSNKYHNHKLLSSLREARLTALDNESTSDFVADRDF